MYLLVEPSANTCLGHFNVFQTYDENDNKSNAKQMPMLSCDSFFLEEKNDVKG